MSLLSFITKSGRGNGGNLSLAWSSGMLEDECGLYGEDYFNEMLRIEAKRTDRTGKPFLLMLLDVGSIISIDNALIFGRIQHALATSTRETDIKGWYRHESVIGVLFTEIKKTNKEFIRNRIFHKVYKKLSAILDFEQLSRIKLSFYFFPDSDARPLLNENEPCSMTKSGHCGRFSEPEVDSAGNAVAEGWPLDSAVADHSESSAKEDDISLNTSTSFRVGCLLAGDLLIVALSVLLAQIILLGEPPHFISTEVIAQSVMLLIYPMSFYIFDLYNFGRPFLSRDSILRLGVAVLLGALVFIIFLFALPISALGRGALAFQTLTLAVLVAGWRMAYGKFFQGNLPKIGAIVLGAGESGKSIYGLLKSPLSPYMVKGFLDDDPEKQELVIGSSAVLGPVERLLEIADQIWIKTAILAIPRNCRPQLMRKILEARLQGIEVLEMPTVYEQLTGRIPVRFIEDQWLLFTDGFNLLSKEYVQKLKRIIDIMVAGLMLICLSPLLLITSTLIKLDSRGPIFYRQKRVGKGGRIFNVVKFRSMRQDAEAQGATWAAKNDSRVTRVGHWIRLFRIDEIPQIWNIFMGDMTLVGPRPERPEFVKGLEEQIPYYGSRHCVAPGITGWAQVNYPYGATVTDALNKLEYDLYYIKNMSLLLDFKILLKTIGVVFMGQGAR